MLYNVPQEKKADCVLAGIVVLTTRGCLLDMLIRVSHIADIWSCGEILTLMTLPHGDWSMELCLHA